MAKERRGAGRIESISFSDIADLLSGEEITVNGVKMKIRHYQRDPDGVDEVRDALEENFDDIDDDDDDDVEDPDDYDDDDEEDEEDEKGDDEEGFEGE